MKRYLALLVVLASSCGPDDGGSKTNNGKNTNNADGSSNGEMDYGDLRARNHPEPGVFSEEYCLADCEFVLANEEDCFIAVGDPSTSSVQERCAGTCEDWDEWVDRADCVEEFGKIALCEDVLEATGHGSCGAECRALRECHP